MNILFLTTKYPVSSTSPYLTNELCSSFRSMGHSTTVINLDWHNDNGNFIYSNNKSEQLLNIKPVRLKYLPKKINLFLAWTLTSLKAYILFNKYIKQSLFDIMIITTPLTLFAFFLALFNIKQNIQKISLCWDFFPMHQAKLGILPSFLVPLLRLIEGRIYASCSKIYTLSGDYVAYLNKNYRLSKKTSIEIIGLWGNPIQIPISETDDNMLKINSTNKIVFGGQFIKGRGNENFLTLCEAVSRIDDKLQVLLIGKGENIFVINEMIQNAGLTNLIHSPQVDRYTYLKQINGAFAGFISLDSSTGCPSFPSKIVDYTQCGLPIIVMDNNNDALRVFIEQKKIGYYIKCNDTNGLEQALYTLLKDHKLWLTISQNSSLVFSTDFNPIHAATLILKGANQET